MFKNKNYVKSRFAVLATGVFLSMLITAPQSQAAFNIALKCDLSINAATVSKPTTSMIFAGLQFNWYDSQKMPLGATYNRFNETTGQISGDIYMVQQNMYPYIQTLGLVQAVQLGVDSKNNQQIKRAGANNLSPFYFYPTD